MQHVNGFEFGVRVVRFLTELDYKTDAKPFSIRPSCVGLEDIVVCRIKSESQIVAMIVTKWLFGHFYTTCL